MSATVAGSVLNVKIEPCLVNWGRVAIQSFTVIADVAGSLNNKIVDFEVSDGKFGVVQYRLWLNINAAGTAPSAGGRTLITAAGATGVTGATLATAIAAAIDALDNVTSAAVGAVVTITGTLNGEVTLAANGSPSPVFTGYAFSQTGKGGDLGLMDGDLEVTLEEQATDITAHQEGTNILDAIRTGKNVELSMTMKETDAARMKFMLSQSGGSVTPTAGTAVTGWGGSKDFLSLLSVAEKLVLHPVVLASNDLTRDFAFWKAYPILDSLAFSGENPLMLPIKFRVFPDRAKKDDVRLFVLGNHTQALQSTDTFT